MKPLQPMTKVFLPSNSVPVYVEPEKENYIDTTKGSVNIQQNLNNIGSRLTVELSLNKIDMKNLKEINIRIFNGKAIVVLEGDSNRIGIATLMLGSTSIIKP